MRLIFFLLVLLNLGMLVWRFAFDVAGTERPARVAQVSAAPSSLRLLGEPEVEPVAVAPALCKTVGPFDSEQSAEAFMERLAALDVMGQLQRRESLASKKHWVHIPVSEDARQMSRRFDELQERSVDSYIIADGELAGGISLGVFSREAAAKVRSDELRKLGYPTETHVVERMRNEFWVALAEGEEQKIARSTWESLLEQTFSVQEQENLCLDVASR